MGADLISPLPLILLLSVQRIQPSPGFTPLCPVRAHIPTQTSTSVLPQAARLSTVGRAVGGIGDRPNSCRLNLAMMMWSLSLFLHLTY